MKEEIKEERVKEDVRKNVNKQAAYIDGYCTGLTLIIMFIPWFS